jgi:hypothetical protein
MKKSRISLIKHGFFDESLKKIDGFSFKEDDFNLAQLQSELSSLYQLFISNKKYWLKNSKIVSYMYYLCNLMIRYFQYDYVNADLQKLEEKRKEIEEFIKENFSKIEQDSINTLSHSLKDNTVDDTPSFVSISKVRKHISMLNTDRSHWGYSRALANHAIIYLQNSGVSEFINTGNEVRGNQGISTDILNLLNKSREPLTIMGITLYMLRFLINLMMMLKHIIQAAINKELSSKKVLQQEIEKRGFTMANDIVWATVNLLTTYNNFFHISALAVSPIIVSFLTFDALLFIAQWSFEAIKYNKRLQELLEQKIEATVLEQAVIQRQVDLLNDEWEVQCAFYLINFLAATILVISFGISMLCSGALALAGLAFFSSLGNALYNATDEFKKYQQAKISVQREQSNGQILNDLHHQKLIKDLNRECCQAYTDFWNTLAYKIGGTAFIITATVVSWPIALSITIIYMAYRLNNTFQQSLNQESKEQEEPHDIYRIFNFDQGV